LKEDNTVNLPRLKEHYKYVTKLLNDVTWIRNNLQIDIEKNKTEEFNFKKAKEKADQIFNELKQFKVEKSDSPERKERIGIE
jgi:hypothetical protein